MGLDAGTTLLAVIGIGIIVVGVLVLIEKSRPAERKEVIVRERPVYRPWNLGPYYSHLPVRHLVY